MAKKDLVASEPGAIAVPEALMGGLVVEGQDNSGARMARLALYQGTSEEEARYGKFDRGVFIDTLEKRPVETKAVMVLGGFTTWSRWSQGSKTPDYTFRNKRDVPKEDLEGFPPAAVECVNLIVIVGGEPWPYLLRIKRTAMAAWMNTIQPNEGRRAAAGKGPGCYQLGSQQDKNAAGQTYRRLTVERMYEPPAEMLELAVKVKEQIAAFKAKADELAAEDDGAKPDANLPI